MIKKLLKARPEKYHLLLSTNKKNNALKLREFSLTPWNKN